MSSDPVERQERIARATAARAQRDRDLGVILIWFGVAIFLVVFLAVFVVWQTGLVKSDLTGLLFLPAWAVSKWVVTRGRRMRSSGAEAVFAEDKRAPIVYLRPFDTDGAETDTAWSSRLRQSPWEKYITHEERMARALRTIGPFVAIGDPTEELPLLGAARVYSADDGWQMTVDELTARAAIVLLQTGDSDGLAWEVHHVVELGAPERVILALPLAGKRNGRSRPERYDAFRRKFNDVFPRRLPESIGHSQFAYFDSDWTPRLLGERDNPLPTGEAPREIALRRLAREFKITWGPRWVRYAAYITAFFAGVWAVIFLVRAVRAVTGW